MSELDLSQEYIESLKNVLEKYRLEREDLVSFARKYKLPIPEYLPPIDPAYAPYLDTPFIRTKNGIQFIPFYMNRSSFLRYFFNFRNEFRPLLLEEDWNDLLKNGFDSNLIGFRIYSLYGNLDKLIHSTCNGNHDPVIRPFLFKSGYFTDWKSQERLSSDWSEIFPFVLSKFLIQLKFAYRKTKGGYSTFFQNSFRRIAIMTYIDYCRSVHKEDSRYQIPACDKFLDIDYSVNVEECSFDDNHIFSNELYYYLLNKLQFIDI